MTAIQDNDITVSDDDTTINADGSFNSDDDLVAIQDNDVNGATRIDVDVTGGVTPRRRRPRPVADPTGPAAVDPTAVSGPPRSTRSRRRDPPTSRRTTRRPTTTPADDAADDAGRRRPAGVRPP